MVKTKGLSLRGGRRPTWQSRAGSCSSYRLPIKPYKPIASVAALTAQPLAALPPYGCGVPLAGSERLAGWQVIGQHHRKCKGFELSLRGGQRPTWQSREGSCVFAVAFLLSNRVLRDSHVASLLGMTNLWRSPFYRQPAVVDSNAPGLAAPSPTVCQRCPA